MFIEKIKFVVTRLIVYLKKQQRVFFRSNCNHVKLQKNKKFRRTFLTIYFEINLIAKKTKKIDKNSKIDYKNVDKNSQNYLY